MINLSVDRYRFFDIIGKHDSEVRIYSSTYDLETVVRECIDFLCSLNETPDVLSGQKRIKVFLLSRGPCFNVDGFYFQVSQVTGAAFQCSYRNIHGTEQVYCVLPEFVEPFHAVFRFAVDDPNETTVIDGAECIAVTYPTYLRDFTALGGVFYEN